jgi:hypothetical protein
MLGGCSRQCKCEGEKQIPCGNDRKKCKGKKQVLRSAQDDNSKGWESLSGSGSVLGLMYGCGAGVRWCVRGTE